MRPGQAFVICFRKFADFKGRAARSEFWWFNLYILVIIAVLAMLDARLFPEKINGVFSFGFQLISFLPCFAVGARRLHDLEMSAWWQAPFIALEALFLLMPFMGLEDAIYMAATKAPLALLSAIFLPFCVYCIWWIYKMATKGTQGDNRYGPDPLTA